MDGPTLDGSLPRTCREGANPGEHMAVATDLKRTIGFWGGTAIVVGSVIGSGIFRTPFVDRRRPPGPPAHPRDCGSEPGFWCCAERWRWRSWPRSCPRRAGPTSTSGRRTATAAAFTFGWLYVVAAIPSGIAALAAFFAELLLRLCGVDPATAPSSTCTRSSPAACSSPFPLINIRGTALGARRSRPTFTVIKTDGRRHR